MNDKEYRSERSPHKGREVTEEIFIRTQCATDIDWDSNTLYRAIFRCRNMAKVYN